MTESELARLRPGANPNLDRDNLHSLRAGHDDMPLHSGIYPVILIPQEGKLRLREKSRGK